VAITVRRVGGGCWDAVIMDQQSEPEGMSMKSTNPTVRRQELGEELRNLRVKARFSLEEAGRVINASPSKVSRMETGHRTASIEDVASLLALYRADHAQRSRLLTLTREADELGWLQSNRPDFVERQHTLTTLEAKAEQIVYFDPVVVPGLLQIGEYTKAIMMESGLLSDDEIEDRIVTRTRRHSVLMRRTPPKLLAVIDESVLYRRLGGPGVLRRQLEHLVRMSARGNAAIRVVPNGYIGASGPFLLLRLPHRSTVVFLEHLTLSLFVEKACDVDKYEKTVEHLASRALDEQESLRLVASVARELQLEASAVCATAAEVLQPGGGAATAD
jgi:transcriptional regulator with XRE-family HTH domain